MYDLRREGWMVLSEEGDVRPHQVIKSRVVKLLGRERGSLWLRLEDLGVELVVVDEGDHLSTGLEVALAVAAGRAVE